MKKTLQAIYEPRGAAAEYAALAVNLYDGCPHGCTYCYVPGCMRRTREEFHEGAAPRKHILTKLEEDCRLLGNKCDRREILLCFTCDPYPMGWPTDTTRHALEIIGRNGLRATVLTKNGFAATRDFDLMDKFGFRFGTSLSFLNDAAANHWEPNAAPPTARLQAMADAVRIGIKSWISIEPVIDPNQALLLMEALVINHIEFKVGKWNHDSRAAAIDWKQFLASARKILAKERVVFKKALLEAAGEA